MEKNKKIKCARLMIIALINIIIFGVANFIFDIKYEQVDDFIIYNLYSGLDGTYNIHGIYIHPVLCLILSTLFKLISTINWHTFFLLISQFICFTIMGYLLLEKHQNNIIIITYAIFASVCYTALLLLIQYTSTAALLIATAFFVIIHILDEKKKTKKYIFLYIILYTLGIMLRMQSLLIIAPFFVIYGIYYWVMWLRQKIELKEFLKMIKIYVSVLIITVIVYISNSLFYQSNEIYKEYLEYNQLRTVLNDKSTNTYESHEKIYNEIGWSENDYFLLLTFNFGDENVYSKENLQKVVDYKISTNQYYNLTLDVKEIFSALLIQMLKINTCISSVFVAVAIIVIWSNKEKRWINIGIIGTTIGINILFLILNRSILRVVIPEYILGTLLLINNLKIMNKNSKDCKIKSSIVLMIVIIMLINLVGRDYSDSHKIENYANYQELINYTSEDKENVYLYTVPALQYRYLAYSVYEMPPQGAFSNLRVMGGWDMFTENYYDFKERYDLEGTFLDLLKDNVYLINGDVNWFGINNNDYIDRIVVFIKEHYDIDVTYEKINEFGNLYIYKLNKK